jgi:hypothetical protein
LLESLQWCLLKGQHGPAAHALAALMARVGGTGHEANWEQFVRELCLSGIELLRGRAKAGNTSIVRKEAATQCGELFTLLLAHTPDKDKPAVELERTFLLAEGGDFRGASEWLNFRLPDMQYSTSAVCHGYAGLFAAERWEAEKLTSSHTRALIQRTIAIKWLKRSLELDTDTVSDLFLNR